MISTEQLIALGVGPTAAKRFQPFLARWMRHYRIETPAQRAGFIAQIVVESARLTALEENLFYTTPQRLLSTWPKRFIGVDPAAYARAPQRLANRVYADRLGNGPESSGDGWRFRGRGLKQLTGRSNYRAAARALSCPYEERPELVAEPEHAVLTACWFWDANGCGPDADRRDWDAVTRRVNGPGMMAAKERAALSNRALALLSA